jgi:ATP-dependent helicase/nuclease subunit B
MQARIPFSRQSLSLSPSKIERYRLCPFSYFGDAVLKLKEKKKNRFANQESGTFLHSILEQFLKKHTETGVFVPADSEAELQQEADELIDAYFLQVLGGMGDKSKQFLHTCGNLRKTLYLLLINLSRELSSCDFLPVGFEVSMGLPNSKLPAVEFTLDHDKKVYLVGSIDRADTYCKNGITYVRVVDYKSYGKTLDMNLVEKYGLDEQMLLYLFSYCRLHAKNGEVFTPAGVLYSPLKLALADTSATTPEHKLQASRDKQLCRTGILLEDRGVLAAMDREFSGKFVPVSLDSEGNLKHTKTLVPKAEFDRLEALVEEQLLDMASRIFDGEMDVRPLRMGRSVDACHYCKLSAASRYNMEGGAADETE